MRTLVTVCALAAVASVAFLWRLDQAPVYLSPDEAIIAVDAHSIATTGRDVTGRWFPLYFQIQMPGEDRQGWFMPAIMYLSAFIQKLMPLSERVARLPSVVVGVADVLLLYGVGRRIFKSESLAILASVFLLITPAHFLLSRYALDYLYPLPFILGWLLCLLGFLESRRASSLLASVLFLGLGFYTYISAVFMMPLYFGFTLWVLAREEAPRRLFGQAAAVFGGLLLPFVVWLVTHQTAVVDTAQHYGMYDTKHLSVLQGMRSFLSYQNLDQRFQMYWSFFSPSFLFFSGDQLITFSTRQAGVFLLPLGAVVLLGAGDVLRRPRTTPGLLVLIGFLTAPLAAVLATTEPSVIIRATALIPFGILLSCYGVRYVTTVEVIRRPSPWLVAAGGVLAGFGILYAANRLLTDHRASLSALGLILLGAASVVGGRRAGRFRQGPWLVGALIVATGLQFGVFWNDYFGDYRVRLAPWLSGNLSGALEGVIELDQKEPASGVYFTLLRSSSGLMDTRNRWMDAYWRFYAAKHHREDLLTRTVQKFEVSEAPKTPDGSLFLAYIGDRTVTQLIEARVLHVVRVIPELDRDPFFVILRK